MTSSSPKTELQYQKNSPYLTEVQPRSSRLIALATKDVAGDMSKELLSAEGKGKLLLIEYTEQRLKENKGGFFDTIKKQNSKTFATLNKVPMAGKQSEKKRLKANRKLLQRLCNAASSGRSDKLLIS